MPKELTMHPTDFPYIDDFCDDEVYVFSTMGQGPKGPEGEVDEQLVNTIVSDWLEEHPEATSTVQDKSITKPKLADEVADQIDSTSYEVSKNYANTYGSIGARPVIRKSIPYMDTQGTCVFGDNAQYCAVTALVNQENTDSRLMIFDTESNALISDTQLDIGHGNGLSYKDDIIVTEYKANNTIVFIDVSDVSSPYIARSIRVDNPILNACWFGENVAYMYFAQGSTRILCVDILDAQTGEVLDTHQSFYEQPNNIVLQAMSTDDRYLYVAFSYNNIVIIFDKDTFEEVGSFTLPEDYGYISSVELEQVYFYDGSMYASFNTTVDTETIVCVFKMNLEKGSVPFTRRLNNHRYVTAIVDYENGSDIIDVNSLQTPVFKRMTDALRFAGLDAIADITVRGNYPLEGTYNCFNAIIRMDTGAMFSKVQSFNNCSIQFVYNDDNISQSKTNMTNTLYSQSANFRFFRCNVIMQKTDSGYTPHENVVKKSAVNGEFAFFFHSCTVKAVPYSTGVAALEGLIAIGSILITKQLLAPFFINDTNMLTARSVVASRDCMCFIHPATDAHIRETVYRNTYDSQNDAIDIYDTSKVYMTRSCFNMKWSTIEVHRNVFGAENATFNNTYLSGTAMESNSLRIKNCGIGAVAWPTQLVGYTGTIYAGRFLAVHNYDASGTEVANTTTQPIFI